METIKKRIRRIGARKKGLREEIKRENKEGGGGGVENDGN